MTGQNHRPLRRLEQSGDIADVFAPYGGSAGLYLRSPGGIVSPPFGRVEKRQVFLEQQRDRPLIHTQVADGQRQILRQSRRCSACALRADARADQWRLVDVHGLARKPVRYAPPGDPPQITSTFEFALRAATMGEHALVNPGPRQTMATPILPVARL